MIPKQQEAVFLNFPTKNIILISIILMFLFSIVANSFLLTKDIFTNFYSNQLSIDKIEELITFRKRWEWIGYVFVPVFYIIKIIFVSSCIYIGLIFVIKNNYLFKNIFQVVVVAELIFLLPILIKLIWFTFIQTKFTLNDFQYFMPLSGLSLFDASQVENWLIYPLQLFNVFEIAYWFLLAYLLKPFVKHDFTESFKLVMVSYGSGLAIWVILVVFLTLNFS